MPTYIYKCTICGEEKEVFHHSSRVTGNSDDYENEIVCEKCEVPYTMKRKIVAPSFSAISSMTPNERREALKKRSHEHFKKNIEESFHTKNKKDYTP